MLLGFVLGKLMEEKLRQALILSRGSFATFVERPVSAGLLARRGHHARRRVAALHPEGPRRGFHGIITSGRLEPVNSSLDQTLRPSGVPACKTIDWRKPMKHVLHCRGASGPPCRPRSLRRRIPTKPDHHDRARSPPADRPTSSRASSARTCRGRSASRSSSRTWPAPAARPAPPAPRRPRRTATRIMMGHMGTHGAAPALYPNLKYDPTKDFEPIGMAAGTPILIVAKKDFPGQGPEGVHRLR